jgi:hypothetical protein
VTKIYPTDALAAVHNHSVTAAGIAAGIKNLHIHGGSLHDRRRKTLLRPSTRHGLRRPTLPLLHLSRAAHGIGEYLCSPSSRQGWKMSPTADTVESVTPSTAPLAASLSLNSSTAGYARASAADIV